MKKKKAHTQNIKYDAKIKFTKQECELITQALLMYTPKQGYGLYVVYFNLIDRMMKHTVRLRQKSKTK